MPSPRKLREGLLSGLDDSGGFHAGGIEQGIERGNGKIRICFCGNREKRLQLTVNDGKLLVHIIDAARLLLQQDIFRRTVVVVYDKVPVLFRGGIKITDWHEKTPTFFLVMYAAFRAGITGLWIKNIVKWR